MTWGPGSPEQSPEQWPAVMTRTYRGKPEIAAQAFQADAAYLAGLSYVPVNQIYVPGSWGCGAFVIAILLFILLIGILVFIYMLLVKPDGTLTVTYQRQPRTPAGPSSPAYQEFPVTPRD